MSFAKTLMIVINVCCISSFAWSVFGVFKKPSTSKPGFYFAVVALSLTIYVGSIYSLITLEEALARLYVGIICNIFSLVLFWMSYFSINGVGYNLIYGTDEPNSFNSRGIYKYIRHPFYASYFYCYLGVLISSFSYWYFSIFLLLIFLYLNAVILEEKMFRKSKFSSDYENYMKETGMFFPNFIKIGKR